MHRLFTAIAVIASGALISVSSDAAPGGGPHVRVFNGQPAAADDGHKDWINLNKVVAIRWAPGIESRNVKVRGLIPRPAASGLPTGKRQHKPFVVIKPVDKASPLLARAAKTRSPLPKVVLLARNSDPRSAGRVPYLKYELKNVRVVNYQTGGSAGDVPTETLSLNFDR